MAIVRVQLGMSLGQIIDLGRNDADGGGQWVRDAQGRWVYVWSATADTVRFDASALEGSVYLFGRGGNDWFVGSAYNDYIDGGDGNDTIWGFGGRDTVYGGAGDDYIDYRFTSGNGSWLDGGDGNDVILGGNNTADNLIGGNGDDYLVGGGGADVYDAGNGNDLINALQGNNIRVSAGAGNDVVWLGGMDKAWITLGDGNDVVAIRGRGAFTISGGNGDDTIGAERVVEVSGFYSGEAGNDRIDLALTNQNVVANGGAGDDVVYTGKGNDTVDGGAGNDYVDAGDGDDTLIWNFGTDIDSYMGGAGYDTLIVNFTDWVQYAKNRDRVAALLDNVASHASAGYVNGTYFGLTYSSIEAISVTVGGKSVDLASVDMTGTGGGGAPPVGPSTLAAPTTHDDFIDIGKLYSSMTYEAFKSALDGNDVLIMADKSRVLPWTTGYAFYGGAGDDTMVGLDRDDALSGDEGSDYLIGGTGNDTLDGGRQGAATDSDTLEGGDGSDMLILRGAGSALGGNGNDSLDSDGDFSDLLDGGAGDDRIYTHGGNDTVYGGAGNDTVDVDPLNHAYYGDKYVDGGTGDDLIRTSAGNDSVLGGSGNDTISSGTGDDSVSGGDGNDVIDGYSGNDTIGGGRGADSVNGGDGNDVVLFNSDGGYDAGLYWRYVAPGDRVYSADLSAGGYQRSDDILDGGWGNDTLMGTDSRDAIFAVDETGRQRLSNFEVVNGGAGDDVIDFENWKADAGVQLFGGAGRDIIVGSGRDDVITGGTFADTLVGGGGNDTFVYSTSGANGNDVILDFRAGDRVKVFNDVLVGLQSRGADPYFTSAQIEGMSGVASWTSGLTSSGNDSILTLKTGDTITFVGVSKTDLTSWLGL